MICPECKLIYSHRAIKRHLVLKHGYRYTKESRSNPVKVKEEENGKD
jgi:hypothetical protein